MMQSSEYIEPKEGEGCIYKITNLINGKVYIGQTVYYKRRISEYKSKLAKGQPKLHRAIKKYGFDNFIVEQISFCKIGKELDDLETYTIRSYDSVKSGYNCNYGGILRTVTDEFRLKMSKITRGTTKPKTYSDALSKRSVGNKYNLGKKRSLESIGQGRQKVIGIKKPILTCPHCKKEGGGHSNMYRWHFDNCKHKVGE